MNLVREILSQRERNGINDSVSIVDCVVNNIIVETIFHPCFVVEAYQLFSQWQIVEPKVFPKFSVFAIYDYVVNIV